MTFTPKGDQIALVDKAKFRLIDAVSGKTAKEFKCQVGVWIGLAPALYRHGLALSSAKAPPVFGRLWNLASGDDIKRQTLLEEQRSLAFAPDERTLAIGDCKGAVHLVDIRTDPNKELRQFTNGNERDVTALTFVDGGKRLVAQAGQSGEACFWDPQTGKLLETLRGGLPKAVTPDGKLVGPGPKFPNLTFVPAYHVQVTPDGKKLLAGNEQVQAIRRLK